MPNHDTCSFNAPTPQITTRSPGCPATKPSHRIHHPLLSALAPSSATNAARFVVCSPDQIIIWYACNSAIALRPIVEAIQHTVGIGPAGAFRGTGVVGPAPLGLEPDGCEPPGVCVGCEDCISIMFVSGSAGNGRWRFSILPQLLDCALEAKAREAALGGETTAHR